MTGETVPMLAPRDQQDVEAARKAEDLRIRVCSNMVGNCLHIISKAVIDADEESGNKLTPAEVTSLGWATSRRFFT